MRKELALQNATFVYSKDCASLELNDLCETARQDLDLLLKKADIFYSLYGEIISLLSDQEIKKISPKIDNI